jgi:Fic family protein
MNDDNWEMIGGDTAHRIEILNYLSQINQIESLVLYSLHHHKGVNGGSSRHLSMGALKELHRTGTFLLLKSPGRFREGAVHLEYPDGRIAYQPPAADAVEQHLTKFFAELGQNWNDWEPVYAGAYTLWFVNWVHPFKNGNGRTARAFCYATMAMKMGFVPPGEITVPELIKRNDDEYQTSLRKADAAFAQSGKPDLTSLELLLDRLIADQLEMAIQSDSAGGSLLN